MKAFGRLAIGIAIASSMCLATSAYAHNLIKEQLPTPNTEPIPQVQPLIEFPNLDNTSSPATKLNGGANGGSAASQATGAAANPSLDAAVPKTPQQIEGYFHKMRRIIDQYNSVVMGLVVKPSGFSIDGDSFDQASKTTQQLAQDIRAVVPPKEMASSHGQLANSLSQVEQFLQQGGAGSAGMGKAMTLATSTMSVMNQYHASAQSVLAKNGLPSSLDPMGGGSASDIAAASQTMLGSMTSNMAGPVGGTMGGAQAGSASSPLGNMFGSLGGFGGTSAGSSGSGLGAALGGLGGFGGGSGGGGAGMDQLGSMLKGLTSGGGGAAPGGIDLNNLMKQMGGMPSGSGASGDSADMKELLGE